MLTTLAVLCLPALSADAGPDLRRGSIYNPSQGPVGLVANKTGSKIGDLVTIVINETQDVKNEESSDLSKSTNLNYELANFNLKPNAFGTLPALEATSDDSQRSASSRASSTSSSSSTCSRRRTSTSSTGTSKPAAARAVA